MVVECGDAPDSITSPPGGGQQRAAAPARSLAVREVGVHLAAERSGLVRRDALCRRLGGIAADVSLVMVVAPPGYGKTIALSQWMCQDSRAFAWVTVQAADNDAKLLLRHIARAMRPILRLDEGMRRALHSPDASTPAVGASRLLEAIRATDSQLVLILDDFHVLYDGGAKDLVVALADGLPAGSRLVTASQSRPRLKLSRLRGQGRCVEFGPQELAFSSTEAREVLAAAGLDLPDEAVRTLLRRTEGWPTGLYVAALSLRDKADPAAAAEVLGGNDTLVVDYFRNDVLAGLSAESVRFLLQTAALDRMSGPLCDAVLDRTGSGAFLADLEGRNLFVVPQDRHGEWYRYHRLFGQMLLSELRHREPGADLRLRQRAAAWYEDNGLPRQAIASAIGGRDIPTASRLICTHGQAFVNLGEADMVRRWLESLGDGALESYPPLAVSAGWIWAYAGDAAKAHAALSTAEQGAFDGRPPDGTSSLAAGTALLRAVLASHGVERMLIDAQFAFDCEPPGSNWHAAAALLLGIGHLLNGAPEPAAKALEQAAHYGRGRQHVGAGFALGQLGDR